MAITPLPPAPSRAVPSTFSTLADAFLAALSTFTTEANALQTDVNAKQVIVTTQANAAESAIASANFKGSWSALTGAATVPYCVFHLSRYWQLLSNIADITAKVPGTAAEWVEIPVGRGLTNLLTNSQWMACSGSTLENVGSDLVVNGGFATTDSWTGVDCSLASIAGGQSGNCLEITRTGANGQYAFQTPTLTVNKLYTLSVYVKSGSSGDESGYIGMMTNARTSYVSYKGITSSGSWTIYTLTFKATETNNVVVVGKGTPTAGTMLFDSVTLYEVTPGYVAADTVAPDGGTKTATLDIHRAEADSTHCKGYYGLKYTKGADTAEYHNILSITNRGQLDKLKGQTVTFGMAGYSVTATDNLKIQIYDGVTAVTSSAFWGADALGWKEISQAVAANATELTFRVLLDGDTADVAYGSFYMAVNGSSIGEYNYAPKPSEQILCDANITLTGYTATTSAADGIINLEAASSGMIGKGVKAVLVKAYGKDSAAGDGVGFDVQSASGVEDGISVDTQVNNIKIHGQGWVKCDSNGDIYLDHRGSGASALTLDVKVIGIEP